MSSMFLRVKVGYEDTAKEAEYSTREDGLGKGMGYDPDAPSGGDGLVLQHIPDWVRAARSHGDFQRRVAAMARLMEGVEKRLYKGSGRCRLDLRLIPSFERNVENSVAHYLVGRFIEEAFPKARVVGGIHQDTSHTHGHPVLFARQIDGYKINRRGDDYRRLDEIWNRIYARGMAWLQAQEEGRSMEWANFRARQREGEHLIKKTKAIRYRRADIRRRRGEISKDEMPDKPEHHRVSGANFETPRNPETGGGKLSFAVALKDSAVRAHLREASRMEALVVGLADRGLWIEKAKNGGGRIAGRGKSVALSRVDATCSLPRLEKRLAGKGADADDERGRSFYPDSPLRRAERRIALRLGFYEKEKVNASGEVDFPVGESLARKITEARSVDFHGKALRGEAASKKNYVQVGLGEARQYPLNPPQHYLLSARDVDEENEPLHEDLYQAACHLHEVLRLEEQVKGAGKLAGDHHPAARRAHDLRAEGWDLFGTPDRLRSRIRGAALLAKSRSQKDDLTHIMREALTEGRLIAALPVVKRALEGRKPAYGDLLSGRIELRDPKVIPSPGPPPVSEGRVLVVPDATGDRSAELYAALAGAARTIRVCFRASGGGGSLFEDSGIERVEEELRAGNTVVIAPHFGEGLHAAAPRTHGHLREQMQHLVGRTRHVETGSEGTPKRDRQATVQAEDVFAAMEAQGLDVFGRDKAADAAKSESAQAENADLRSGARALQEARRRFRAAKEKVASAERNARDLARRSTEQSQSEGQAVPLKREQHVAEAKLKVAGAESDLADASLLKRASLQETLAQRSQARTGRNGQAASSHGPHCRLVAAAALLRGALGGGKENGTEPAMGVRRVEEAARERTMSATLDAFGEVRGVDRELLARAAARYLDAKARHFDEQAGHAGEAAARYREALRSGIAVLYKDPAAAYSQLLEELESAEAGMVASRIEADPTRYGFLRGRGSATHRQQAFEAAKQFVVGYAETSSLEVQLSREASAFREASESGAEEAHTVWEGAGKVLATLLEQRSLARRARADEQHFEGSEKDLRAELEETEAVTEIIAERDAAVRWAADQKDRAAKLRKKRKQRESRRKVVARVESLVEKARPFFAARRAFEKALAPLEEVVSERIGNGREKGAPAEVGVAYLRRREQAEKQVHVLQRVRPDASEAAEELSEINRKLREQEVGPIRGFLSAADRDDLSEQIRALRRVGESLDLEDEVERVRALDRRVLEALRQRAGHWEHLHEKAKEQFGSTRKSETYSFFASAWLKEDLRKVVFDEEQAEGVETDLREIQALVQLGGPGSNEALIAATGLEIRRRQERMLEVARAFRERAGTHDHAGAELRGVATGSLSSIRSGNSLNREISRLTEEHSNHLEACRNLYREVRQMRTETEKENAGRALKVEGRLVATARLAFVKRRFMQRETAQERATASLFSNAIEAGRILSGRPQAERGKRAASEWAEDLLGDAEVAGLFDQVDQFEEVSSLERVATGGGDAALFLGRRAVTSILKDQTDTAARAVRAAYHSLFENAEVGASQNLSTRQSDAPRSLRFLRQVLAHAERSGDRIRSAPEAQPKAKGEQQRAAQISVGAAKLLERGVDASALARGAPAFQQEALLKGAKPVLDDAAATEPSLKEETFEENLSWFWALRLHLMRAVAAIRDDYKEQVEQFEQSLKARGFESAIGYLDLKLIGADSREKEEVRSAVAEYAPTYLREISRRRAGLRAASAALRRGASHLVRVAFEDPDQAFQRVLGIAKEGSRGSWGEAAKMLEDPRRRQRIGRLREQGEGSLQTARAAEAAADVLREYGRIRSRLDQLGQVAAAVSREQAYGALPRRKTSTRLRERSEVREKESLRQIATQAGAALREQTAKLLRTYQTTVTETEATRSKFVSSPHTEKSRKQESEVAK